MNRIDTSWFIFFLLLKTTNCMDFTIIGIFDCNITANGNITYKFDGNHFIQYVKSYANKLQNVTVDFVYLDLCSNETSLNVLHQVEEVNRNSHILGIICGLIKEYPALMENLTVYTNNENIPLMVYNFTESVIAQSNISSSTSLKEQYIEYSKAMALLTSQLGWTYVQSVYQSSYEDILNSYKDNIADHNICVLKQYVVDENTTNSKFTSILDMLMSEEDTKGIVLFMNEENTRKFFEARNKSKYDIFIISLPSIISKIVSDSLEKSMLGAFAIAEMVDINQYVERYRSTYELEFSDTESLTILEFTLQSMAKLVFSLNKVLETSCVLNDNTTEPGTDRCIARHNVMNLMKEKSLDVLNLQKINDTYIWKKIADISSGQYNSYYEPVFYDKNGAVVRSTSYSSPFRFECRPNSYNPLISGPADLYIVGVLPVHHAAHAPNGCGRANSQYAILAEAIAFGVEKMNKDPTVLPNLKLGYIVLDSCELKERVQEQFDKLFAGNLNDVLERQPRIIGTVGFPDGDLYLKIAPYMESRKLVTISNSASSPLLSDKRTYPYFMRMVAPISTEGDVTISLLRHLNIKNVGIVYSKSSFGSDSAKIFVENILKQGDIQINYQIRFEDDYANDEEVTDYLVKTFIKKNAEFVRTIVIFTEPPHLKAILKGIKRLKLSDILWIGSEKMFPEEIINEFQNITKYAITIGLPSYSVNDFGEHLQLLTERSIITNIFLREYLEPVKNGQDGDFRFCNSSFNYGQLSHVGESLTIDSVTALSRGVDMLIGTFCPKRDFCRAAQENVDRLPEIIQSKSFIGISGNKVQFDSKGDSHGTYNIVQFTGSNFTLLGSWKSGILNMTHFVPLPEGVTDQCSSRRCFQAPEDIIGMNYLYQEGDPMLYGFLQIHNHDQQETACSDEINEGGFQIMNSILWAIREINEDNVFLPNVTLGLAIFDTCGLSSRTERLVRSVLTPTFVVQKSESRHFNSTVLGLIGGDVNPVAIAMEKGARLVDTNIPIVISSPTPALNDQIQHPRIYRTVLPGTEEMEFLLQFLPKVNWTYVHVIYEQSLETSVDFLQQKGRELGICLASKSKIDHAMGTEFFYSVFHNITLIPEAIAVVLLVPPPFIRSALSVARDKGLSGKLYWIIPNDVGTLEEIYEGLEDVALGLVTIRTDISVNRIFLSEFLRLSIVENISLPWLPEFWQELHKCNLRYSDKYNKSCTSNIKMDSTNQIKLDCRSAANINGVFALAKSLHDVLNKCTTSAQNCIRQNSTEFYSQMEHAMDKVRVTPNGGTSFSFHNRNATTSLLVLNLQLNPKGNIRFIETGSFRNGRLNLDFRKMKLYYDGQQKIMSSVCSGLCRQCFDADFLSKYTNTVNTLYLEGPPQGHSFGSAVGVITIILNAIGLMLIGTVIYYLWGNVSHKAINLVVDANICLLFGSVVTMVSSTAFLMNPSYIACAFQRAIPGCVLTLPLGCLLIKLNKAVCLRDIVGRQQIKVPRWDFSMTYLPVVITSPVTLYIIWFINQPTTISWTVPDIHEIERIEYIRISWMCNVDRLGFIMFFIILWQLLLQTFILSVNYRIQHSKQPEVKQVMWSSLLILLAVLIWSCVLFFSENFEVFSTLMCLLLPVVGISLIVINFLPLIVVLIREEQQTMAFSESIWKYKTQNIFDRWRENGRDNNVPNQTPQSDHETVDIEMPAASSSNSVTKKAFLHWKRKDNKEMHPEAK